MRSQDRRGGLLQRPVRKIATGFLRRRLAGNFAKSSQRLLSPLRRDDLGSVVVEFAIIMPVLLMLLFGIVEFGRTLFVEHSLSKAVRDGARYAIVHGGESGLEATVEQITDYTKMRATGLNPDKISVTITYDPDNFPGSSVTVQGNYSHDLMIPFGPTRQVNLSALSKLTIFN